MIRKKEVKGVPIRLFNYVMGVVACALYAILIYGTLNMSERYQKLIETTNEYIACEKDASLLKTASDYLTVQARLYVVNGEAQYMDNYFTEVYETRRRNEAVEDLKTYHMSDEIYDALQNALDRSETLSETEIYAMKLAATAKAVNLSELPEKIQNMVLNEEDTGLNEDELLSKAQDLIFGSEYQDAKEEISDYVSQVVQPLLSDTQQNQNESALKLEAAIVSNRIGLSILLIIMTMTFVAIAIFILKPLNRGIQNIKENKLLDVTGAYEFRYLAKTYNDIYSRNVLNEEVLRKKAEHDALTGILNRGAFERLTDMMKNEQRSMALLLVDVDEFKTINDTYGHNTGDLVLKTIAKFLQKSFRASDSVARIGGDEFCVVMLDMTSEQKNVIQEKVDFMNGVLKNPTDGLPSVSLSIGVAFSSQGYHEELFKQADSALYDVKTNGRCGCAFYGV
jgi:diguanylate cyclase (GGDEF)-like protein